MKKIIMLFGICGLLASCGGGEEIAVDRPLEDIYQEALFDFEKVDKTIFNFQRQERANSIRRSARRAKEDGFFFATTTKKHSRYYCRTT